MTVTVRSFFDIDYGARFVLNAHGFTHVRGDKTVKLPKFLFDEWLEYESGLIRIPGKLRIKPEARSKCLITYKNDALLEWAFRNWKECFKPVKAWLEPFRFNRDEDFLYKVMLTYCVKDYPSLEVHEGRSIYLEYNEAIEQLNKLRIVKHL